MTARAAHRCTPGQKHAATHARNTETHTDDKRPDEKHVKTRRQAVRGHCCVEARDSSPPFEGVEDRLR